MATVKWMAAVKLTSYSHGAGCACKLGQDDLSEALSGLKSHPAVSHSDLVVGIETGDDAAVIRLDGKLLVQTIDFFTPIVDDAYDWGRIAAANALSDVYAMGGRPLSALQVVAWPRRSFPSIFSVRCSKGGPRSVSLRAASSSAVTRSTTPSPSTGWR